MDALDGFALPDRYEAREVLAASDAEVIYRGVDRTLRREVLLKRPGPALALTLAETGDESRALREARALAQLRHDGIVRLLDVVECKGGPLLVLEPTPGEPLAEALEREGKLSPADVRRLGVRLADALQAVHAGGAVHRGLSSANIILRPDGDPCLAGFLFAKFSRASIGISSISYGGGAAAEESPTAAAKVLPSHPAPEQIHGQSADARSDIFGLGCVLYRCLTGVDAFPTMLATGWSPPRSPTEIVPEVPKELAAVIMKCISRSPLARFPTAGDAAAAFAAASCERTNRRVSGAALATAAAAAVAILLMLRPDAGPLEEPDPGRGESVPLATGLGTAGSPRGLRRDEYTSSHALLIGIGDAYPANGFARLPNAVTDIDAIRERLLSLDFPDENVTVLRDRDATDEQIRFELGRLSADLGPDDRLFVYYAGHGERHERSGESGWLVPADGVALARDRTRSKWIRFEEIAAISRDTAAKHVLIAMDCCYSGRIATDRSVSERRYQERYLTQVAHFVLCSGRDEPVTDGATGHSPFAASFLDALGEDGIAMTASELAIRIERDFIALGVDQQVLFSPLHGKGDGEFVFFLDGAE